MHPRRVKFDSDVLNTNSENSLLQFVNCSVLRADGLRKEHIWVRNGRILDEKLVFFEEKRSADVQVDCNGLILSPGFIDVQLNGGFGIDFSTYNSNDEQYKKGVKLVAKQLLAHGVTSFAPTVITSSPDTYHKVLPLLKPSDASEEGAGIVGAHVEGPFISKDKRGCHPEHLVISTFQPDPAQTIRNVYGSTENIAIVTMAPELDGAEQAIEYLVSTGTTVSVGHSSSSLGPGEMAYGVGARMITHLFNAMRSYHHRDPGLIGLLTSTKFSPDSPLYYGIISDGIHTHDSALRIAYRTNSAGLVLVTDAIAALGMADGVHKLGTQTIHVKGLEAKLDGTDTTAGSVASMPYCIRHLIRATGCSIEFALHSATHKPAKLLGIKKKGTLDVGSVADFVLIDENVSVKATFCSGARVFLAPAEE
uniref:N-acetylglucosamine-6-phosphate deacetylase n=1 Tax=Caenorhabditis japonica TaxID=281687 RepID=A0A8R1ICQ1_CAEJA